MFGFVTPNEQDLSESEMARYRQVYCGVCRSLRDRSGQLSRLTLNHDLTFVGMLLTSLYEPVEEEGEMACPAHPVKKRAYATSVYTDYAADMTVVMAYHKLMDNWADDRSVKSRVFAQALKGAYVSVKERHPRQCAACEQGLERIAQIESEDAESSQAHPDRAAHEFGLIMAEAMVFQEDPWAQQLRAFGYELGRFIYMMDAAFDVDGDADTGSFNPFVGSALDEGDVRALLEGYMARAVDVFERLPLVKDVRILQSVLYAGVWKRLNAQQESKNTQQKESEAVSADDGQAEDGKLRIADDSAHGSR